MSVKNILFNNFSDLEEIPLPKWLDKNIETDNSSIKSYLWKSNKIRRIRFCELNVGNKFFAESLVIYPEFDYETPILGTEYLNCSNKKYFGTIDFHPLKNDKNYLETYVQKYLAAFPDRTKNESKIYNLEKYFSKKLWLKSFDTCFYKEYLVQLDNYIKKYKVCLEDSKQTSSNYLYHKEYDHHLSCTDPAYGILKAHYNKEFAEDYIYKFLFDLGSN